MSSESEGDEPRSNSGNGAVNSTDGSTPNVPPDCKKTASCFTAQFEAKEGRRCNVFISIENKMFEVAMNIITLRLNTLSYVQPGCDVKFNPTHSIIKLFSSCD